MTRNALVPIILFASIPLQGWAATEGINPLQLVPQHATLLVADIDREERFFIDVLGFRELRAEVKPGLKVRLLEIPGYRIDLIWREDLKGAPSPQRSSPGWVNVVFQTANEDADKVILKSKGADLTVEPASPGRFERLVVHDPEGNEIQIQDDRTDAKK